VLPASIPSPSRGVIHIGPLPLRAYALCIIAGIVVAVVVGERRLRARGARPGAVADIATWAVPFGLIGARIYHVATDPELYWGAHGQGTRAAFEIWHGGLGIWGAIAGGALGAWIGCRRSGVRFADFADALAPGVVLAQAIGRWGNYFNQELYGRRTNLPWGVEIDPAHQPTGSTSTHALTYQPTFLYESLWDIGVALVVIWADRRWRLTRGRAFALYAALYTAGRFWIETLRVDPAHKFLGLRLNDWVSVVVFAAAVAFLVLRRHAPEPAAPDPPDLPDDDAGPAASPVLDASDEPGEGRTLTA
jgi:prolipoprotein diacylglyceryl transferase